jgi:hypothetical protein
MTRRRRPGLFAQGRRLGGAVARDPPGAGGSGFSARPIRRRRINSADTSRCGSPPSALRFRPIGELAQPSLIGSKSCAEQLDCFAQGAKTYGQKNAGHETDAFLAQAEAERAKMWRRSERARPRTPPPTKSGRNAPPQRVSANPSTGGLTRAPTSFKHLRSKLLSRTVGGTLRSRCACQHQVEADPCRDGRAVRCPNRRPRLARETDLLPLRRADMVVSWTKRRP